jgi:hypothetical protein
MIISEFNFLREESASKRTQFLRFKNTLSPLVKKNDFKQIREKQNNPTVRERGPLR